MISTGSARITERLRLGIEAARAGQNNAARTHFVAVLRQDPQHILALLWLAFVLPAPQDSLHILERVLALDPHNEQAKAGLRWAREHLGLNPNETVVADNATRPTRPQTIPTSDHATLQRKLPARTGPGKTKGKAVAQRRAAMNPLLTLIIIAGLLGITVIGLGGLIFGPPDTLAAWLPSFTPAAVADITGPVGAAEPTPSLAPVIKSFTSAVDTISLKVPRPLEPNLTAPNPPAQPEAAEPSLPVGAPTPQAEIKPGSIEPALLIGPELPLVVVDRSQLAHQPAYPGEKWIEINVTSQQMTAWEGDMPVMSFSVSTGLPQTPTVLGEFNIYWKLESTDMSGPGYYVPEVPYTMYFHEDYALHGTYWHNNFGQRMSRGCVNLQTDNAKKLFEWADPAIPPGQTEVVATQVNPGTLVVVHE